MKNTHVHTEIHTHRDVQSTLVCRHTPNYCLIPYVICIYYSDCYYKACLGYLKEVLVEKMASFLQLLL